MKYFLGFWFPVILWLGIIFSLSSLPASKTPELPFPHLDKIVHVIEFAILGMFTMRAFNSLTKLRSIKVKICLSVSICVIWAISDELHQLYVPGRQADFFDFIADVLGVCLALWLFSRYTANSTKNL